MNNVFLKDVYSDYFPIGAAISHDQIESHKDMVLKHFSSITPENELKFMRTQPEEGRFVFNESDKIVQFAKQNDLKLRGHTLICNEPPNWVFRDKKGKGVPREIVLERMQTHINNIVNRYKEEIYCWDVVNEAIDDNDSILLHENKWLTSIGSDYIDKAFQYAHEADPNALLFYNDYNAMIESKREKIYQLIKGLVDRGTPIHGIGLQGHFDIYFTIPAEIKKTIEQFADLGLKIQITEMDISVYRFQDHRIDLKHPTLEMIDKQTKLYEQIFGIFREYRDVISGVTLWGIADDHTWRDDYPVRGRKDWPLLFGEDFSSKPALEAITNFNQDVNIANSEILI